MRAITEAEWQEWKMADATMRFADELRRQMADCNRDALAAIHANDHHSATVYVGRAAGLDNAIRLLEGK